MGVLVSIAPPVLHQREVKVGFRHIADSRMNPGET